MASAWHWAFNQRSISYRAGDFNPAVWLKNMAVSYSRYVKTVDVWTPLFSFRRSERSKLVQPLGWWYFTRWSFIGLNVLLFTESSIVISQLSQCDIRWSFGDQSECNLGRGAGGVRSCIEWKIHVCNMYPKVSTTSWDRTGDYPLVD